MTELVVDSLAMAAEAGGDINDAIYARYFELCPDSRQVMQHTDEYMRGRMLDEVYRLVMNDDTAGDREYLTFETGNHQSYGAQPHMYENLLLAVRDVVRDAMGDGWSPAIAAAWDTRMGELLGIIRPLTAG
ncbi:MAG: globin [Pseudomonadales bacterium]|nr:globin [Pseudomonadales bacterium]